MRSITTWTIIFYEKLGVTGEKCQIQVVYFALNGHDTYISYDILMVTSRQSALAGEHLGSPPLLDCLRKFYYLHFTIIETLQIAIAEYL